MAKSEGREQLAGCELAVSVGWGEVEPGEAVESYTWFHVAPGLGLDVVILSTHPTMYRGHYIAGAVLPCSLPRCAQCQAGIGVQRRCVLSVYSLNLACRGLLEVGERTAGQIHAQSLSVGFLRGLAVHFSKEPETLRGRIVASEYRGLLECVELPAEQDPLVPLNAQWAKLMLRHSRKDGSGNVKLRGEAASDPTTPSNGVAVPSDISDAPKTPAEARAYILKRQREIA